jgi:predicted nucleic acid-binding Zn ribbon protein
MSAGLPYDRREPARLMGDVLKSLMRRKKFHEKGKFGALVDAWRDVAGEAIASRSRIRAFKQGVLAVEVDSCVLLHEMNGFMKQQLVLGMQATAGGRDVAEIRLYLGTCADGLSDGAPGRAQKA